MRPTLDPSNQTYQDDRGTGEEPQGQAEPQGNHIANDRRFAFKQWADDGLDWDQETGAPGIGLFGDAVQVWSTAQMRRVSVADAARAFNIAPERIVEAVEAHYWMILEGTPGDDEHLMIEHEGE